MRLQLWMLGLVLGLASCQAAAVVLRVGADSACDAATLDAAIAQLPAGPPSEQHEIRLNRGAHLVPELRISERSVKLSGGWISCSDARAPDDSLSTLRPLGELGDRLLNFDGGSSATELYRLDLRLISIADATEGALGLYGRGQATLGFGAEIVDSRGAFGGGVHIAGNGGVDSALLWPRLRVTDMARIGDNRSNVGAGIYCQGGGVVFLEGSRFRIDRNRADMGSRSGGGLWAENCILAWIGGAGRNQDAYGIFDNQARLGAGLFLGDDTSFRSYSEQGAEPRVVGNRASENGGGFYVASGAQFGWSSRSFELRDNAADNSGGGVFLEAGGTGRACAASIIGNRAGYEGGALFLDGGSFTTDEFNPVPFGCYGGERLIADNIAGLAPGVSGIAAGGALRVRNGSQLILNGWTLRGNRAPQASAIFAEGVDTRFFLRSVSLAANRSEQLSSVVRLTQIDADLHFISAGGNVNTNAVFETLGGGSLELDDSAIYNPPAAVAALSPGTMLDSRCLFANEQASLLSFGGDPTLADPRFYDAAGGDLRVAADSPLLDACAGDQSGANYEFDARLLPRPVNLPQVDLTGPWDAGAFEMRVEDYVPLLFRDGFE